MIDEIAKEISQATGTNSYAMARRIIGLVNGTLDSALRTTACDGTFDEMAIRKAVSFELAGIIMEYRTYALQVREIMTNATTR